MVIFRFILGGLLAVGSVNISNAMSDEAVIENENFLLCEELDNISGKISSSVVGQLREEGKQLSREEAKIVLFEIHKRTVEELKKGGFDLKKDEFFPQKPEDIPDEEATLLMSGSDDYFRGTRACSIENLLQGKYCGDKYYTCPKRKKRRTE